MLMKTQNVLLLLLLSVLFTGCWINTNDSYTKESDKVAVIRYDRLQTEYIRFNSVSALQKMSTTYGRATQILVEEILAIGNVSDDNIDETVHAFYSDSTLLQLIDDTEARFEDLSHIEKQLTKGFKRLKKELPSLIIPTVYAQISALNESIVVSDSLLGISLDKYMGEDYPLYHRYYYDYQRRSMRPERIVPDCFIYYMMGGYPLPPLKERTLLERILRQGQIYYIIQQVLEYNSIADVIGYTEDEKKWWEENREEVWEYMTRNQMLNTTDPMVIRRLMYPVPTLSIFGERSPAFIGICMGGEVISAYMKRNKKVTLEELLNTTDYHYLLNNSGF